MVHKRWVFCDILNRSKSICQILQLWWGTTVCSSVHPYLQSVTRQTHLSRPCTCRCHCEAALVITHPPIEESLVERVLRTLKYCWTPGPLTSYGKLQKRIKSYSVLWSSMDRKVHISALPSSLFWRLIFTKKLSKTGNCLNTVSYCCCSVFSASFLNPQVRTLNRTNGHWHIPEIHIETGFSRQTLKNINKMPNSFDL